MDISPMDKMWASFVAIGLMVLSAFVITFARTKTKGFIKFGLSAVAVIMLLVSIIYMLVSMT